MNGHGSRIPGRALVCLAVLVLVSPCVVLAAVPTGARAGDGSPESSYTIPEIRSGICVDGVLDEEAWQDALVWELAYETNPGENVPPPVETRVLLAYSRTHLYAAFVAHDPDPAAICANISDRDRMFDDDRVSIILDTFNDQRRGYMFFCNPLGIQGDALDATGTGAGDAAWDAIWDSAGRITDEGYIIEMAIPFSSLRFQRTSGVQTWGIGVGRKYSRSTDYRMAHTPRDRDESCYLCQVSKVSGFAGVSPGRNIEFDPTISGFTIQEREDFPSGGFVERDSQLDLGVTARWGITPNLVLSSAVNPDFSQVEADAFELDVNTRFAIYYEEKRPFFLEGMEFFRSSLDPVYTRTIADPSLGLKLTGKEGANGIGVFIVRDEVTNLLLPASEGSMSGSLDQAATASVLRYRRDVGEASTLGAMVTDREGAGYHNRLGGVDGNLRLAPTERVQFQVLASRTTYPSQFAADYGQPDGEFDGMAYDLEYNHDSSALDWWLAYREIERGFRADVGFRPQSDFRQARTGWSRTWRAEAGHWYSSLNSGCGYVYNEDHAGDLLAKFLDYWFNYEGPLRSSVNVYGIVGRERYQGVEYDDRYTCFEVGLWPTGTTHAEVEGVFGDAIDYVNGRAAEELELTPSVQFKVGRRLDLWLVHQYERVDVEEGWLYTANISYVRAAYQFTRQAFLRAIVQYRNEEFNAGLYSDGRGPEDHHVASQILFSYKINPQTVLYLGYSDNHFGDKDIDLTRADRTFFAKIGYAWVM